VENLDNVGLHNFIRNLKVKQFSKLVYIAEVMIKSQVLFFRHVVYAVALCPSVCLSQAL